MSFTASFYNCDANPKKLDKTESLGASVDKVCKPFEPVDDLHGSILIDWVDGIESYNYVKISQNAPEGETTNVRDLYCFIQDWVKETGTRLRCICEIDPLMTNKDGIKNCYSICSSASVDCSFGDKYISNGNFKVSNWIIYSSQDDPYYDPETGDNPYLDIDSSHVVVGIYG